MSSIVRQVEAVIRKSPAGITMDDIAKRTHALTRRQVSSALWHLCNCGAAKQAHDRYFASPLTDERKRRAGQ